MWQKAYELFTLLFTITHRLNRHDDEIEASQQGLHTLTDAISRLFFEQVRTNDELKRLAEREADEVKRLTEREAEARKLFQVQVENQLLRAGRYLPAVAEAKPVAELPVPLDQTETLALKTQVAELSAAMQKADEQRTRDQTEIAQLKAQMAELLAHQPKQES